MEALIWLGIIVIAILAAVIILWWRLVGERRSQSRVEAEAEFAYADVEYQWTQRQPYVGLLIIFLILLAGFLTYQFFTEEEFSGLSQLLVPVLGIILALLNAALKSYTFQIAHGGLFVVAPGTKTERKRIFAWDDLLWFKPENDGFKYYLKPEARSVGATEGRSIFKGNKIPCGKQSTLINAMIMARGIPTSLPRE